VSAMAIRRRGGRRREASESVSERETKAEGGKSGWALGEMEWALLPTCPSSRTKRDTKQGTTTTRPGTCHLAVAVCLGYRRTRDKTGARSVTHFG
jgi:hypothetical protein